MPAGGALYWLEMNEAGRALPSPELGWPECLTPDQRCQKVVIYFVVATAVVAACEIACARVGDSPIESFASLVAGGIADVAVEEAPIAFLSFSYAD
ncbi:hypothetical protein V6N13_032655 [Hibiscus sabdariffa]|uniref:Uncharacterized protein n=2 Tax=Hibiscus sabdariffa TaxID=183260 RepID=A0ABR1ZTK0_9ROSI